MTSYWTLKKTWLKFDTELSFKGSFSCSQKNFYKITFSQSYSMHQAKSSIQFMKKQQMRHKSGTRSGSMYCISHSILSIFLFSGSSDWNTVWNVLVVKGQSKKRTGWGRQSNMSTIWHALLVKYAKDNYQQERSLHS